MAINLQAPTIPVLRPVITVFGIGGAGGNAVNNMAPYLKGTELVAANTDSQPLETSLAGKKIQLGETLTRGLGAGASPEVGKAAAEESLDKIHEAIAGSNMIFITAGMGGGTGTGAAPVIARAAKESGILTVAVVTKPFHFEGSHRMRIAESGLIELRKYVDTLVVIPNQNLFRIANESTTFAEAFKLADHVLHEGVRCVTDLITMPGLINLDFADIEATMKDMGKAMMGTGEAEGENRAIRAAELAISNPLLDHTSMKGAKGVLINITGGPDMTLFDVDEAATLIKEQIEGEGSVILGAALNEELVGKIRISVIATGIDSDEDLFADQYNQQRDSQANLGMNSGNVFANNKKVAPGSNFVYQGAGSSGSQNDYQRTASTAAGSHASQHMFQDGSQQQDFDRTKFDTDSQVISHADFDISSRTVNIQTDNFSFQPTSGTHSNPDNINDVKSENKKDQQATTKRSYFLDIPAFLRRKKNN